MHRFTGSGRRSPDKKTTRPKRSRTDYENPESNSGNGNPFGDGLRCAGGGVRRPEVRFSNSGNGFTTQTSISIATSGNVSAGQTKRYQYWYRDSGTSPCSSLFNLSNGYEISWGA